ncbi:hypothetical protein K435DRAFT_848112 [Dendrothele bispora CBS 962.96]|uniref:RING-CH-type domain-containing protein n=1 Tax=Dendrothele bispora (strain CBS 962.96) TaxID=1314807 RepID=A0A4S8MWI4_DENBC|nr:hypothetical protein K435DRAFT_848112 [Dendrothele bispora CBS 962.96]
MDTQDTEPEKQCRICLDGVDAEPELGRLIRPCLCKGSISYVHVGCLKRWRTSSPNQSAFFSCLQCHYRYRFARTSVAGIATNPIIVGGITAIIFTMLTMVSSTITTYLLSVFQEPTSTSFYYSYGWGWYFSPFETVRDLVRAALRIIQDNDLGAAFGEPDFLSASSRSRPGSASAGTMSELPPQSAIKKFIQRFVIGLPLLGAGSLIQMLISVPFIAPVQWIARYRGNRRRNNDSSRDITSLIIIALIAVGAARALLTVYRWTESLTKKMLMRAEDAILEVN